MNDEVFDVIIEEYLGTNSEAQGFLQRDGQVIIRMRGLPFDATAKDVVSKSDEKKIYSRTLFSD